MEVTFDMDEARVTVDAEYDSRWEEWTIEVVEVDLFDDEGNFLQRLDGAEQCAEFQMQHASLIEALTEKTIKERYAGE